MRFAAVLLVALSTAQPACTLNALGWDEKVTEKATVYAPPVIADDVLADKHPVFDPSRTVVEQFGSCKVTLNKSASITKLDLPPYPDGDAAFESALCPGYAQAVAALGTRPVLPSMELLQASLKPFDDGLYAAVELAAEDGSSGSKVSKGAMMKAVLAQLVATASGGAASEQALARSGAAHLAAAVKLAGEVPNAPSSVLADADARIAQFDAESLYSRPMGFYTWSAELSRIFRRDRFLQSSVVELGFGEAAAIAHAFDGAGVLADYQRTLDLYAGLTDRYYWRPLTDLTAAASAPGAFDDVAGMQASYQKAHPEVRLPHADACSARLALLPPSESPDARQFRTMFCATPPPSGTNLLDVLVNLIRSGQLDLTPDAKSGWLARQLWALETLLVPESAPEKDNLFLTAAYKKKLINTFQTIYTENRETHAKQTQMETSDVVSMPAVPIDLYPNLPIEPFPSYYLRTARAYRFVLALLTTVMGQDFLAQAHRLKEDGTQAAPSVGDELAAVILRAYGFYALAADSIGSAPTLATGEDDGIDLDAARKAARAWLASWATDADLARDPRVITPILEDRNAGVTHYWAMVGVRAIPMRAEFIAGHEPQVIAMEWCSLGKFVPRTAYLLIGKTLDVAIPSGKPPPTRAEFRALCDQKGSADAIAAALTSP
jgi:hypothetical protein